MKQAQQKTLAILMILFSSLSSMAQVQLIPDGYYKITNHNSNLVIDIRDTSYESGTQVQLFSQSGANNQHWETRFVDYESTFPYRPIFAIICTRSGAALDVDESTGKIQQYSYGGGNNQLWNIVPVSGTSFVQILSRSNSRFGYVLEVVGSTPAYHATIGLNASNTASSNQMWTQNLVQNTPAAYEFIVSNSPTNLPMVLDVYNSTYENGTDIQQSS